MADMAVRGREAGQPHGMGAAGMREAAPWIIRLARIGYAAKGAVYIIIGLLAVQLAFGDGGETTDSRGALQRIGESSAGDFALALIGIGLLGYAIWRLIASATDAEGRGSEAKGMAIRAGQAARGLAYGALGVEALRLMTADGGSGGGNGTAHWTARLLGVPFGRWLVIAAGVGVIGYALYQLYRAASDKVRKHLALEQADATTATWVVRLGRFGIAARAVVFALMGWFLIRAALNANASEAGGVDRSLDFLRSSWGPLILGIVAVGLVAYGCYQLANARYRRMRMS